MVAINPRATQRALVIDAARHALEQAGNITANAVPLMVRLVANDETLQNAIMHEWLSRICDDEIAQIIHRERGAIIDAVRKQERISGTAKDATEMRALAIETGRRLMDFPLPGGKRLAEATGAEAIAASDLYLRSARAQLINGRWLRAVGEAAGATNVIGVAVTEEAARELRTRAEGTNE